MQGLPQQLEHLIDRNVVPKPPRPPLTGAQQTRLAMAEQDAATARKADLVAMDPASLVILVEHLRGTLDDLVRLVDEIADRGTAR